MCVLYSWQTMGQAEMCAADSNGMMGSMMQDLAFAIPGVDEAMSFAEIMKCVKSFNSRLASVHICGAQARQVHGVLCDCVRHRADRTHSPFPIVPDRAREGVGQAELAQRSPRAHDQPNDQPYGRPGRCARGHVREVGVDAFDHHGGQHAVQGPGMYSPASLGSTRC